MSGPKVYLAGPDVFLPDPLAQGALLKVLCRRYGFDGQFPLDGAIVPHPGESKPSHGDRIRTANLDLLRDCALVLANVSPFRGPSADDGTAYEMGYAAALGKPVFAYSSDRRGLVERTRAMLPCVPGKDNFGNDGLVDASGMFVEDFALPVNLMLVTSDTGGVHESAEAALIAARAYFQR